MKKNLRYLGIVFILSIVVIQVFLSIKEEGNLILFVQNNTTGSKPVPIKLFIDDELVFDGTLMETTMLPKRVDLWKFVGSYDLIIEKGEDGNIIKEKILLFSVKWVVVNFYDDEIIVNETLIPPIFD